MQVQIPSEHRAFGPHGDGLQGFTFTGSGAVLRKSQSIEVCHE